MTPSAEPERSLTLHVRVFAKVRLCRTNPAANGALTDQDRCGNRLPSPPGTPAGIAQFPLFSCSPYSRWILSSTPKGGIAGYVEETRRGSGANTQPPGCVVGYFAPRIILCLQHFPPLVPILTLRPTQERP